MSFENLDPEFSAPNDGESNGEGDLLQNKPDDTQAADNFPGPESSSAQEGNKPENSDEATPEPKNHKDGSVKSAHSVRTIEDEHTRTSNAHNDAETGDEDDDLEKEEDEEDKSRDTIKSKTSELEDESPQISIQKTEEDGRGLSLVSDILGGALPRTGSRSEDISIDLETFMMGSIKVDRSLSDNVDNTSAGTTPSVAEKLEPHRTVRTSSSPIISMNRPDEDVISITGDFMDPDTPVDMSDHSSETTTSSSSEIISSSVETAEIGTEEHFDRAMYYESYSMFHERYIDEKLKNDFLHGRVAEHYRKRKMFHVLAKEPATVTEAHKKYNQHLEELDELQDKLHAEEDRINNDLEFLRNRCRLHNDQANTLFEKLQHRELDVAKEFSESDSSKVPLPKIIDRFMKRQKLHLTNLVKMRFNYIKCKNRLIEKQNQLKALDNLGSNFHLIDYEQLKHDNRNLKDKLEERDKELTRIRKKCQNAMQILAHRREKASAMDADIANMSERLEFVKEEYNDVREQLNVLKHDRDDFRNALHRIKDEAGLLAKPKLLRDLELATSEVSVLSDKVQKSKQQFWDITFTINNMRQSLGSKTKLNQIKKAMAASGADTGSKKSTSTSSASSDLKLDELFA